MEMLLVFSAVLVIATLVTLCRVVHLRRLLAYATLVDIVFSVGVFLLFSGSFAGLASAAVSGLLMAVTLSVLRSCIGYDTLRYRPRLLRGPLNPSWYEWVHTPRSKVFRMPTVKVYYE